MSIARGLIALELLAQRRASTEETRLHRPDRDAQNLGDLVVIQPPHVAKHHDRSLLGVQTVKGGQNGLSLFTL